MASGTNVIDTITVAAYLERWHREKGRHVKPRTVALYRELADRHILPRIGHLRLSKITPLHLQEMCSNIADEIGARTANMCRTQMVGALKQAVRWQMIARNPAEAVTPFGGKKHEPKIWNSDEAGKFLAASREHALYPLFYLAMSSGMRRGELLGLKWEDLRDAHIAIRRSLQSVADGQSVFTHPKSAKGVRRVALAPDAIEVMEQHQRAQGAQMDLLGGAWIDNGLIFTTGVGTPIYPRNLQRSFHRLQEKAGVPKARLHDLRHLHASLAIKEGMDAKVLADRLGHARASFTLDVYTHLFELQREASAVSIRGLIRATRKTATKG